MLKENEVVGMETTFPAFVVDKPESGFTAGIRTLALTDLPAGEVVVRVAYSGVNYKDALALQPEGQVVRRYPMVPGIDLAGEVAESSDPRFAVGASVIVTSYGLGATHFGGFSTYARVPAAWVVPLPEGLTVREAMALGTAGFTAALALHQLERNGVAPEQGTVLVTGATGGVGSFAIQMLARRGYAIAASTGKADAHDYLRGLGASEILSRDEIVPQQPRPLEKERWAGAIDAVGGASLAAILRATRQEGSVAACGLTGGAALNLTVHPFILRGVNLLGIDSALCPMPLRQQIWSRLATDLKPAALATIITREVTLAELPEVATALMQGAVRGRVLVQL
jgi:putative YhdH/YhfP family quinone oxidoreductase